MIVKHRIRNGDDTWVIKVAHTAEELDIGQAPVMEVEDGYWQVVFDGWDIHVHSSEFQDEPSVPFRAMKLYVDEIDEFLKKE